MSQSSIFVTLSTGEKRGVWDGEEEYANPQTLLQRIEAYEDRGEQLWIHTDYGLVRSTAVIEVFTARAEDLLPPVNPLTR